MDKKKPTLEINDILEYLPHRYPFLLLDRVVELEENKSILAYKNVTIGEQFFVGHFPQKPVMPGVLIVEALAQAAGVLAYKSNNWHHKDGLYYFGGIDNTRFKKIVSPGDRLYLKVEVTKARASVWKFSGQAIVDNEVVCSSDMTCVMGSKDQ